MVPEQHPIGQVPPYSDKRANALGKRAKRADPNKKTRESFGVVEVDDDDTMTIERKLFSMLKVSKVLIKQIMKFSKSTGIFRI